MANFIVYKSSAGSGKTYTLMIEYLSLALMYPNAYSRILAITFTNKAANEIKQRILESLEKLALQDPENIDVKSKQLLSKLTENTGLTKEIVIENSSKVLTAILHNYSDFAVSTIDSFMHKVIRSFAFDLKLSMNFDVELDTTSLLNAAVDELISKVGKDDTLTDLLKNYVIQKAENDENWDISDDLKKSASSLFKEKMAGLIPELSKKPFSKEDYDKICALIKLKKAECKSEGVRAIDLINRAGIDPYEFKNVKNGIGSFFLKVSKGEIPTISKTIKSAYTEDVWFPKNSSGYIKIEPVKQGLKEAASIIESLFCEMKFLDLIKKNFHSTLLLKKINDELDTLRQQRNIVSISDFNNLIGNVVKDQPVPFIYLRVGEKFRHFMIDEFQDTSGLQWENLLPLIENSLGDSKLNMIVGDGKQAIYRFKNGDAEQFVNLPALKNATNNQLKKEREQLIKSHYSERFLDTNYRSRKEIVEFNNEFFKFAAPLFIPAHESFYKDVIQKNLPNNEGGLVQFDFTSKDNVVNKVIELVGLARYDGYAFGDIAILCRANKDAIKIAEALQLKGIKVVSSESLLLTASAEINFLINWIGVISNPDDKVSLQGIIEYLKSVYSDTLTDIINRKPDKDYLYSLLNKINIDLKLHSFNNLSFYDSIELLIRKFHLIKSAPVYLHFFLDVVLDFSHKESSGATGFIEYWNAKSSNLSISVSKDKDAVQLLTVHKSKGLDFPVVIYAFPDPRNNHNDLTWNSVKVSLHNDPDHDEVLEMPMVYNYGSELEGTPLEGDYLNEKCKMCLDKFNLYYVAFTRASERLYVVLEENSKKEDSPKKLSDLVSLYIKKNEGSIKFGDGRQVIGKYKIDNNVGNKDIDTSIDLSYESGDWHQKITLAKRSPDEWSKDVINQTDYGMVVHKILSEIETLDQIEDAANYIFNSEMRINEETKNRVIQTLHKISTSVEMVDLFKGTKIIREQEIITPGNEVYRPDRVVVNKDKTVVIDFKTGIPTNNHMKQLLQYLELIKKMEYKNPLGYILYLGENMQIVKVELSGQTALSV
jgi:ATP-dependent exoDNAse (exonuclease V) beta subunit